MCGCSANPTHSDSPSSLAHHDDSSEEEHPKDGAAWSGRRGPRACACGWPLAKRAPGGKGRLLPAIGVEAAAAKSTRH